MAQNEILKEILETEYSFPFENETMTLLGTARHEAETRNHEDIGTGHLALGYLETGTPRVLHRLGIQVPDFRRAIEFMIGSDIDKPKISKIPELNTWALKTLAMGIGEAQMLGDSYLQPDHVMLGLVRIGN